MCVMAGVQLPASMCADASEGEARSASVQEEEERERASNFHLGKSKRSGCGSSSDISSHSSTTMLINPTIDRMSCICNHNE